jgi:hypothetical protein
VTAGPFLRLCERIEAARPKSGVRWLGSNFGTARGTNVRVRSHDRGPESARTHRAGATASKTSALETSLSVVRTVSMPNSHTVNANILWRVQRMSAKSRLAIERIKDV